MVFSSFFFTGFLHLDGFNTSLTELSWLVMNIKWVSLGCSALHTSRIGFYWFDFFLPSFATVGSGALFFFLLPSGVVPLLVTEFFFSSIIPFSFFGARFTDTVGGFFFSFFFF